MTRKTVPANEKKYVYLVCMENKNKTGCKNNKGISLKKFEEVILKVINLHIEKVFELSRMLELAGEIPYVGYTSEKLQDTIMDKEMEIEKKRHYNSEIYQDYKDGIITKEEYMELKEAFRSEIITLKDEIHALQEEVRNLAKDREDKVQWVRKFIKYRGFTELSRDLLLQLVKEIRIYDKERIEVVFKFQSEYEELLQFVTDMANDIPSGHPVMAIRPVSQGIEGGTADGTEKSEKY